MIDYYLFPPPRIIYDSERHSDNNKSGLVELFSRSQRPCYTICIIQAENYLVTRGINRQVSMNKEYYLMMDRLDPRKVLAVIVEYTKDR
jgi:hypothetical protein